ncbi:phage baseplate protein [Capnocytophaga cynodegmi]|uniref:Phage baseplate protein n=1 Tax=Capnocytophaga cynodegmi TaxID=28189 RepID=A0A250E5D2_9FLAO|nr:phage baseplate assembly protein V [Capnocytophaga cynodegmi]ATA68072.1 phage baseplate protein [Capnocytophaga cynodegmi]
MYSKFNTFSTILSDLKDVKTTIYVKGKPLIFDSLVLQQSLNSCHSFEVIENFLGKEDLIGKKSPKSLTEFVGERIHIEFQHKDNTYEFIGFITEVVMDSWENPQGIPNTNYIRYIGKGAVCILDDVTSMFSFVDSSLTDIIQELTYDYQKHFSTYCNPKFEEILPFAMQYNESVFEFLNRLSALYNELFFYDGKELFFGLPVTNEEEELTFDEDIISLKMTVQTLPHKLSQYDYFAEKDAYLHSQKTTEPERQNMLLKPLLSKKDRLYTSEGIVRSSVANTTESNLDDVLQGHYNTILGNMHILEGKTKTSRIKVGRLIRVHFSSHYNLGNEIGVYRVVSVEHRVDKSGSYENHFVAIPQGLEHSLATIQTVAYPEIAEVVNNEDPEKQGRVQVQFYWQKHKNLKTNWLRVQTLDAGLLSDGANNRGVTLTPEVGDQVMVNFEQGNPHRPYVSGSMFHGKNASGVSNNVRSIITKSGHKLVFTDDESIILSDKNGNQIKLDTQGKNIEITAPENITMKAKNIVLEAEGYIDAKAKGDVITTSEKNILMTSAEEAIIETEKGFTVKANSDVTVKSKGGFTANISADLKIEASGDVNIEGKGNTQIKGSNSKVVGSKSSLEGNAFKVEVS